MIVADLILKALRQAGVIDASIAPDSKTTTDALEAYNAAVAAMRGDQIGPKLSPRPLTATTTAFNGTRYINATATTRTLSTPPNPKAGSRFGANASAGSIVVTPNGYLLEGSTSVVTLTGESRTWFFEDESGDWVREQDAAGSDDVVFSDSVLEPLADVMTVRLSEEFGIPISDEMKAHYQQALSRIAGRYGTKARNRVI